MDTNALIALIGSLIPVINNMVGFVNRTAQNLKQSAELTPAQEAELDARIAAIDQPAWWKPDASQ